MHCQICSGTRLHRVLALGHQPPSDNFLTTEQLNEPEVFYPLDVYLCENCWLVQLGYCIDPELIFRDYLYTTSSNPGLVTHFSALADKLAADFRLGKNDLAIDVGSNDGTLLKGYLSHGVRVLGVEPSSVATLAEQAGIPTVAAFFNEQTAEKIAKEHGRAKIITATNVFAHVRDLHSFVEGAKKLLTDDGAFITESHHLLSMIKEMQYDAVYHEHLRYYAIKPLQRLFADHGMDVFDVECIGTHGGSIRVYACLKGARPIAERVSQLLQQEADAGLYRTETYDEYGKRVAEIKCEVQELLRKAKQDGKRIFGIGAPAKGSTLLNYCAITPDVMDCTVETSSLKIGRFTPGTHVPIVTEEKLFREQPDYALILSWNIKDIIMPKLKKKGFKGRFIIPNPVPEIVSWTANA